MPQEVVEDLIARVEQNSQNYFNFSQQSGVPLSTCQKIIKQKLHIDPYKITTAQQVLLPGLQLHTEDIWFQNNLKRGRLMNLMLLNDETLSHYYKI